MTDINNVVEMKKTVVLSDGSTIEIPRLTNKKVLHLVKFVAGDGVIIYSKYQNWREKNTIKTPSLDEDGNQKKNEDGQLLYNFKFPTAEQFVEFILEEIPDEKLMTLLSILLDQSIDAIENMDFFDTSLIIAEFIAVTPIEKLIGVVKKAQAKFRPMTTEESIKKALETPTNKTASATH